MFHKLPLTARKALLAGPRWSLTRVALDLLAWFTLAAGAQMVGHPALVAVTVVFIGAVPLHDILVHGHEATHGNASKSPRINSLLLWFTHAIIGLSGRAYRSLHLDHHTYTHSEMDSEVRFLAPKTGRPTGWSYLRIPLYSHWRVNTRPGRPHDAPIHWRQVAVDLAAAAALHGVIVALLGPRLWLIWLIAPIATGLSAAMVLRAITEHHGADPANTLTNTRATIAHRSLQVLWCNVDHHLEHHLAPGVPWHRLPELRRQLAPAYEHAGVTFDRGLLRTAVGLLFTSEHFAAPNCGGLAHRMKVRWFMDILRAPEARLHLWSLYYHGEAYEELHPLGVWIHKLAPHWASNLRSHLDDENRHAALFAGLLAAEGHAPRPLQGEEDVGWYLLHQVVPDVCRAAGRPGLLSAEHSARYLGFLHSLERRSVSDLEALLEAAKQLGDQPVCGVVTDILADERWHAAWTWRAMCKIAGSAAEAEAIYEPIRTAERRAMLQVTRKLLAVFEGLGARPQGTGRLRWTAMRMLASMGLAVPLLPSFDPHGHVPARWRRRAR
ncbi:MAG: fatty acid desaturase [Kiritimatiellia bacterium]|jgi:fatty acid desaturase